jgi:hypothetical protein
MRHKLFLFLIVTIWQYSYAQFSNVKKGDILDINGTKGIVFSVNEEGNHGTIMSVKAFRGEKDLFCSKSSYLKGVKMNDENDGRKNTTALFEHASTKHIILAEFPVFRWCKTLGKGWYIPSVEQLKVFVNYWLGNEVEEEDWDEDETTPVGKEISHKKKVNNTLLESGGIPFLNGVFSSTVDDDGKILVFQYDRKKDFWQFLHVNPMKIDKDCVGRAFYDF